MQSKFTDHHVARFWDRLDRSGGEAACWVWTGYRNRKGYGMVKPGGRSAPVMLTHRFAWLLTFGMIPDGLCVLHRCDNPPCCNPAHLFLGTVAENNQDMIRKGRMSHHNPPVGRRNSQAKLSEADVATIRRRRAAGESLRDLASEYGLNYSHISGVVNGKTWRHVTTE